LFQGWPTLPLTEEDTNWGDCPDDASDISEDWDDYCSTQGDDYSVKKGVGFVKWEENVFGTNEAHDQINNVGHVIEGPQICLNITPEEHREEIKQAARKARMEIINNLDPESKEKLVKREFQVYRQKKLNQPTLTIPTITQTKPSPSNLPPPEAPKTERVDLNFDFEGALSKMHVTIPLKEVIKVPSIKERFDKFFKGSDGPMDPPIMLQADHFRVQYDEHPPFFMTLLMNNKSLNNCMLDSGVGANMMSLKVMQQLGLKVTRPYRNVCGFESKAIPTHGVVENVEVCLKEYPEKVIHIDIVIVDVPDVWGMLLSRKFASMLGGTLEMDLTYVNIPLKNGIIGRLPNVPVTGTHVQETSHPVKNNKAHEQVMEIFLNFLLRMCPLQKRKIRYNGPREKDTNNS
jgi:hypothetical protein